MRLASPAPAEMLPWLTQRAGLTPWPDLRAIAAVDDEGRIAGMVGFDGWMPGGCSLHIALENPAAFWTLARPAARIAFLEFGFAFLVAPVLSKNKRAMRFVRGLGFREKARFKDAFGPGAALVLHEMRREDCRWIRQPNRRAT